MEFTFADNRNPVDDINFIQRIVDKIPESREEKHERAKNLDKRYETLNKRNEKLYKILYKNLDSCKRFIDRERIRKTENLINKTEKEMHYNHLESIFLNTYLSRVERY